IHFGQWGTGLFQSLYEPSPGMLRSLPLMPEWYLLIAGFAVLTALGALWPPLLWSSVFLTLASGLMVMDAAFIAADAHLLSTLPGGERRKRRLLTFMLHLLQPLARLRGRLGEGLAPWRWHGRGSPRLTRRETILVWSEKWLPVEERLLAIERSIREAGTLVYRGGPFDRWDLEARGGLLGRVRLLLTIEEHGAGRQMVRARIWPRLSGLASGAMICLAGLAVLAIKDDSISVGLLTGLAAVAVAWRTIWDCSVAHGVAARSVGETSTKA
ncbi:MAG: glycosyl transferase, partial [Gemmatimonadota bacterium]|nr:glycosyl transferase [Gemmatimonadota bacterium]